MWEHMKLRVHFGIIRKLNSGFQTKLAGDLCTLFLLHAAFAKGIFSDELSLGSVEFVTGL